MDRVRKQVLHLQAVNCSGIEVASFYSVPDQELSVRPAHLEPLVFENTLCFRRAWWEQHGYGFGEAWEARMRLGLVGFGTCGRCRGRARAPWSPGGPR